MSATTLIHLGGCYHLLLIVFHLLFWRIFDWRHDLQSLSFLNRAIMQVLNIMLTAAFGVFAWISFRHADALLGTDLGRDLLLFMSVFWLLRAGLQAVFFGARHLVSWAFLAFFVLGSVLYGIPAFTAG
ncbi:MAG: hypothetical protein GY838_13975 [bacterium]|nr:hypothetical protein [bacterium]